MKQLCSALFVILLPAADVWAQDINACKKISAPSERLACFDDAHNTPETIRFPKTESRENQANITPQLTAEERFGKQISKLKKRVFNSPESLEQLTEKIEAAGFNRNGKVRVTLTNGQIWQQLNSDDTKIIPSRLRRQSSAEIKRGALGSFIMKIKPWGRSMKVKRID
jgi:Rad3-related DNA helicase